MSGKAKRAWLDVLFLASTFGVLFAGMRGFQHFFPTCLAICFVYVVLVAWRLLRGRHVESRRDSGS